MGWMNANKMKLNPDKTEALLVGSNSVLGSDLMPTLSGVALTPGGLARSLGVLLDPGLQLGC